MAKNGKFECFKCVLHHFRMRYDLYVPIYQNSNFHHILLFFHKIFSLMVEMLTRSSSDEFLVFEMCLETSYLFPKLFWNTRITFSSVPTNNTEKSPKSDFHSICSHTWSSSGWVPMIRKVLPSESMSSHEHFSYISCRHIFKRSTVILSYLEKTTPLVSYNEM